MTIHLDLDVDGANDNDDEGYVAAIAASEALRCGNNEEKKNNNNVREWIEKIKTLETNRRNHLREASRLRHEMKQLQQSLRPGVTNKNDNENSKEMIKLQLKEIKDQISQHESRLHVSQLNLKRMLSHIGNIIDTDTTRDDDFILAKENKKISVRKRVRMGQDLVFCLGGYEIMDIGTTLTGGKSKKVKHQPRKRNDENVVVLVGWAASCFQALSMYAQNFLLSLNDRINHNCNIAARVVTATGQSFYSLQQWEGNVNVSVSSDLALEMMGCKTTSRATTESKDEIGDDENDLDGADSDSRVTLPFQMSFALLYRDKTFWDRQLPWGHVYRQTISNNNDSLGGVVWWEQMSFRQEIGLWAMTTSVLEEARAWQTLLSKEIVAFYQSFVLSKIDDRGDKNGEPLVWIERVSPTDLELHEVSRFNIMGRLDQVNDDDDAPISGSNRQGGGKKTTAATCLASVSNWTDYVSRPLNIRCGERIGGHVQYVYMIHATICSNVAQTIDWMVHCNHMTTTTTNGDGSIKRRGIGIPRVVARYMTLQTTSHTADADSIEKDDNICLFVPFQKQIVPSQVAGKRPNVKAIHNAGLPGFIPLPTNKTKGSKVPGSQCLRGQEEKTIASSKKGTSIPYNTKDEDLMNPFPFLPLYKK